MRAKKPGLKRAIRIGKHAAGAHRAGVRINLVVHEIDVAFVRETRLRPPDAISAGICLSRALSRLPSLAKRMYFKMARSSASP